MKMEICVIPNFLIFVTEVASISGTKNIMYNKNKSGSSQIFVYYRKKKKCIAPWKLVFYLRSPKTSTSSDIKPKKMC